MEIKKEVLSLNNISNYLIQIQDSYKLLLNENKFLKEKKKNEKLSISKNQFEIKGLSKTIYIYSKINPISIDDDVLNKSTIMNNNYLFNEKNLNYKNLTNENYDFILQITRMIDLFNVGWDYYCSDKFEKYLKDSTINYLIGIFGNKYSGKSFILRKLFNKNITYKGNLTPSLSFKIFQEQFIIFDAISTNVPLLNNLNKIKKIDTNLSHEEKEEEEKRKIENQITTKLNELFIREYFFQLSNLCVYIINTLGYNELEQLIEIENNFKSNLIVIHNLYMINSLEEINNYCNIILINQKKNLIRQQINDTDYYFYYEEIKDKKIIHLILGNDNFLDINTYNNIIIDFLKKQIKSSIGKKINFFNNLKEILQEFILKYFNLNENSILNSNIINDKELFNKIKLKLKNNKMFYKIKNLNNLYIRFKNISINFNNGEYREKNTKIIQQYKIYKTENHISVEFNPQGDVIIDKILTEINNHSFEKFICIKGQYTNINQENNKFIFNNIEMYNNFILIIGKDKFDKIFLNRTKKKIKIRNNNNIKIRFEILKIMDDGEDIDTMSLGDL